MKQLGLALLVFAIVVSQSTHASPPGGKKGRSENAPGIIAVFTQDVSVTEGLFSDQWAFGDADSNVRYYGLELNGREDPDEPGVLLEDGGCVLVVTPAEDGVDRGKLQSFLPFGPADCPDPTLLRQLKVLGSGQDLDGDGAATDPELIDAVFGCEDVFPNDSPVPGGVTMTSCQLEVRQYDESGEFERSWKVNWPVVGVTHLETDVRQIDTASDAEIFQLVSPPKGNGKKEAVSKGSMPLPFRFQIKRLRTP